MMRCRHREAPHGCKCGGAGLGEDYQSRPGMDRRGCVRGASGVPERHVVHLRGYRFVVQVRVAR